MLIHKETKALMREYVEKEFLSHDKGLCTHCGNEMEGVEPDAEGSLCESCGKQGVSGLEELLGTLF